MLKVYTRKFGEAVVVFFQGRIVVGDGLKTLRETVVSQLYADKIILDLSRVSAIDAGGLGVMLELFQHAEANGIDFKLMNLPVSVRRLLEMTRLDSVFKVSTETEIFRQNGRKSLEQMPAFRSEGSGKYVF